MKQILQDLANGGTSIIEAPAPQGKSGNLVINSSFSLISAGTERMLVEFGRASYLDKARQQPEKVKMVLDKVQTDGLMTTVDAVRSKLGQPIPLGYSNVGVVENVGKGVENFTVGDRVVSNGSHADVVRVPKNLCAKIPDNVSNQTASFTVVGSIGLQGIRLIQPTLGECIVVIGVGLIGLMTVQLLIAQGCRVLAVDYDDNKLALAKSYGAEVCNLGKDVDPVTVAKAFSRGNGVDGVIITASTKSNDPVSQGAKMCRKRGRIVLVGVVGLELNRSDFYDKEISFQVSCSYGAGRYDPSYEDQGHDYPIGYVRWSEQRNFEAVLDMMSSGKLNVDGLITKVFAFEYAPNAYDLLTTDKSVLGILLNYTSDVKARHDANLILSQTNDFSVDEPVVGFIGAGNYATRTLIPSFKKAGANLHTLSTTGGTNSSITGRKLGFIVASTDTTELINNDDINTVAIVTQHNSHAHFVTEVLTAGKNVFVEKPLALGFEELVNVEAAYSKVCEGKFKPHLMVGFNRRFSPHIQKMKQLLSAVTAPKSFIMTMNAGNIPSEHWTQDPQLGGGRIIGEACHYIDLMRHLADSPIVSVQARRMGNTACEDVVEDKVAIILGFEDGSFGTIHYYANGASSFPKERIEVFAEGKILQLDNFLKLKGYGWPGFKKFNLWMQDKGQNNCSAAFLSAIHQGLPTPIAVEEIFEVARVSIEIATLLREQQ